jgi:hypothetical protein
VVEAEKVQPLPAFAQLHDPCLGVLEPEPQLREDRPQRRKGALGLRLALAQHDHVVRVPHQNPVPALRPLPVKPMQIDVAQAGRDHPALRGPSAGTPDRPILHHPGAQHRAQELEGVTVDDPLLDRRHQLRLRNRLETVGDIRLHNPPPAAPRLINEDLERVVRRASGSKPERALEHVSLEDRLNDDLGGRLNNAIANSRNRERTQLLTPGLRDEHPARGKRPPTPVLQIRGQLIKQPGNPVLLDISDGLLVDAGRAAIGAHQLPRPLQDVPAVNLVIERVEPSPGIGLGRPVKRSLQFSDFVLPGGPSHFWHSPALPCARRMNEAAALPSPRVLLSRRLKR